MTQHDPRHERRAGSISDPALRPAVGNHHVYVSGPKKQARKHVS